MTDSPMVYNAGAMSALVADLRTYQQQLQGQHNDAEEQRKVLDANWQGQGNVSFDAKHKILMDDLTQLTETVLKHAIDGVQAASDHAFTTDGKVAATFE
ncbi:WXG100 family type VII secretion target [Nocardia sp. NPDC051052]|uniref:WXG100 family type VII secretion target n=1 Tax=Nocardia sp. NPDC051052 TaxID=3364322 RepID=UPI0037BB3199